MKKFIAAGIAILIAGSAAMTAAAQTSQSRAEAAASIQPAVASLSVTLGGLQNQYAAERSWAANARAQLAQVALSLQTLAHATFDTETDRAAAATVLGNARTTVQGVADQMTMIEARHKAQVAILAELTAKFQALVSLFARLP